MKRTVLGVAALAAAATFGLADQAHAQDGDPCLDLLHRGQAALWTGNGWVAVGDTMVVLGYNEAAQTAYDYADYFYTESDTDWADYHAGQC